MVPFAVLILTFAFSHGLGFIGVPYVDEPQHALRIAVAVMLLITASAHWGPKRPDLIRMVPPMFSAPAFWVTLTGWFEIIGAILIILPYTSFYASMVLTLMLLAMFPANVYAARNRLTLSGKPVTPIGMRTLLQFIFIAAVLLAGWNSF